MHSTVPFPDAPDYEVGLDLIHQAAKILAPYNLDTPLLESPHLSQLIGRPVFIKCENQQRTGSFKVRGALFRLTGVGREDRARGVVASSAGNHGLGVAWACRMLGIPGLVVVPETVSRLKRASLEAMLIKVRLFGRGYDEAEACARSIAAEAEATFISPFDNPWVMAGNGGTVGLEIQRQLPGVSAVIAPLGGGGLAVGLAVALEGVPVVGVNSEASAAMARSLSEGRVYRTFEGGPTIAEGLEGGVSSTSAWLCRRHLQGVEVVSERSLREAIRLMVRWHGLILEGSAATPVAALLEKKPIPAGGPVCLVLTGRNIDREALQGILVRT